jgi:hypothetical protein
MLGRVFYCRIENEHLTHLVMIGGTHLAWQGHALLQGANPREFGEWRKRGAVMH